MIATRRAFSLVELLVSIGIVALLIGILLPSLVRARSSSRTVQCASNLHQIEVGFAAYSADNQGRFPANLSSPAPGDYWSDDFRVGHYVPSKRPPAAAGKDGGGVYICPEDTQGAYLSYSMNVWASSGVDSAVSGLGSSIGIQWSSHTGRASQLILVAESYSMIGSAALGWYAQPTIGTAGTNAAQRFGFGSGLAPPVSANRWGHVTSELDFMRHRLDTSAGVSTQPVGRLNIGFADGHVATLSNFDFVNNSGANTGTAFWSPADWGGN